MAPRRTLILGGLLVLLAGASLIHWRGPLKERVKNLFQKNDRDGSTRNPGPWIALSPADTATIGTPDPPPFDRACRSRSDMVAVFGDRTIHPNIHYDFEHSSDSSWFSEQLVHTGRSSALIREGQEYSPAIKRVVRTVADTLIAINAGLWMLSDANNPSLTIVCTVERGGQQLAWFGKDLDTLEHHPGQWQRLNAEFPIRDQVLDPEDVVSVYLWNRNKHVVFFDDMDVVFRSGRIPGKAKGTAYSIEDPTDASMPLPFAKVSFLGAVEPSSTGIVAGQEAPAVTSASLPTSPGSAEHWQYTPGSAVGKLIGADGVARALVRAWSPEVGRDLLGFEQLQVTPGTKGLRFVGFDVDINAATGTRSVAREPAPMGAELLITMDVP